MSVTLKPRILFVGYGHLAKSIASKFFLKKNYKVIISGKKNLKNHSHLLAVDNIEYLKIDLENEKDIKLNCEKICKNLNLDLLIITGAISNSLSRSNFPFLESNTRIFNKFLKAILDFDSLF